jgi:alpha-galactosidase
MMRRITLFLSTVILSINAMAFNTTVKSRLVGDIAITSNESVWKVATALSTNGEREIITIELDAPKEMTPPRFNVAFHTPQLDAHHLWDPGNSDKAWLQPDWRGKYDSSLARYMPLYSFINGNNRNRLTIASSEAIRKVVAHMGLREEGAQLRGELRFFVEPDAPRSHYKVTILIDKRDLFWADAVREGAQWIESQNDFKVCNIPDAAFDPLYSSWYQFHQQITDKEIEAECREAVKLGMKTIIVDDGWQTADNNRGYAYCGDWEVAEVRIKDMAAHVKRVQEMGMRYMLWYSVPFVGIHSKNFKRFEGKYLTFNNKPDRMTGVLDPRFPEVREFICSTYEKALRDWNLDGFKLDFIDSFRIYDTDPAVAENYAGRDIKSVSEAVNVLMKSVVERLQAIKPDILIEFRQRYVGPAIRQYGNMFRATDCPGDMLTNRARIASLRLTSGTTAVHADMLEWNIAEKPEVAARHILSALYGVVQYSVMLRDIPQSHLDMVRHWIDFSQKHRQTLLHGTFRPYFPQHCYPILEAEGKEERIITIYQEGVVVEAGNADRVTYIINATGAKSPAVELQGTPRKVEYYDTYGKKIKGANLTKGLQRVDIPISGYVKISY